MSSVNRSCATIVNQVQTLSFIAGSDANLAVKHATENYNQRNQTLSNYVVRWFSDMKR